MPLHTIHVKYAWLGLLTILLPCDTAQVQYLNKAVMDTCTYMYMILSTGTCTYPVTSLELYNVLENVNVYVIYNLLMALLIY